jgi:hypothetical protein
MSPVVFLYQILSLLKGKTMAPKLSAKQMIREGLEEVAQADLEAAKAYWELSGCHCCCCTGECTYAFQESTEDEQSEWLASYWASVEREWLETIYKI